MDLAAILKSVNDGSFRNQTTAIQKVLDGDLRWCVEHGDNLIVLKSMPDACVDAIVTDPPAGISFMGKEFDSNRGGRDKWIAWLSERLAECCRVTKPGGRMLCWSIPRTMHWTGTAIEDAGWQIENTVAHVFGSGFPKAKTQLKPAREDWWLARKPAKNVLPLNIDECRVRVAAGDDIYAKNPHTKGGFGHAGANVYGESDGAPDYDPSKGRWPANLVLSHAVGCVCVGTKRVKATSIHGEDVAVRRSGVHAEAGGHQTVGRVQPVRGYADADGQEQLPDWRCVEGCPIAELDRQSGTLKSGKMESTQERKASDGKGGFGEGFGRTATTVGYEGDSGGASRFFNTFEAEPDDIHTAEFIYQAKASRQDRGEGNNHPTVKSTPLMRHLVKLITKPGDVVLDAFCGSGSTGRGALLEGCQFIGIEREEPYVTIAKRRLETIK